MKWSNCFPILVLLLVITACGKRENNGKKIISLNERTLGRLIENQNFECESISGDKCPEGVARVVIYNVNDPDHSALCSGFLVKSDTIVTNNHCVSNQIECENTHISIYNGSTFDQRKCESIVHTEVDNAVLKKKKIDLTVLKLNQASSIKPFSLSPDLPTIGEKLKAWVIDHLSLTKARITELSCEFQSDDVSMKLKSCPIIEGNSGSPLVNNQDEVVGLIWGSTVDETITAELPLEERRKLPDSGFATSLEYFRNLIDY